MHCAQMLNAPTMNMHIEFDTLCDNNDDNGDNYTDYDDN